MPESPEMWMKIFELGGSLAIFLFFMWRIHAVAQKQLIHLVEIIAKIQSADYDHINYLLKQQNKIIDTSLELMLRQKENNEPRNRTSTVEIE